MSAVSSNNFSGSVIVPASLPLIVIVADDDHSPSSISSGMFLFIVYKRLVVFPITGSVSSFSFSSSSA